MTVPEYDRNVVRIGPRADGRAAAIEYWSRKVFGIDSHPIVVRAVMSGRQGACERAWGRLEDKRSAAGRDGSTPLRDPEAFYCWALRGELQMPLSREGSEYSGEGLA